MLNKVFAADRYLHMQLFAGELTNQNREYYKVNDKYVYTVRLTYCTKEYTVYHFSRIFNQCRICSYNVCLLLLFVHETGTDEICVKRVV